MPLRIAIGPRDLKNNTLELARRDTLTKSSVDLGEVDILSHIKSLLDEIQESIYRKAYQFREEMTTEVNEWEEFQRLLEEKGGFLSAHWDGTAETEELIKEKTKATIRCVPIGGKEEYGNCIYSGRPSKGRVLFARAY